MDPQKPIHVIVQRGASSNQIAIILKDDDVIKSISHFKITLKLLGASSQLKAGNYHFKNEKTYWDVIQKLREGEIELVKVTLPEGTRASKIAQFLSSTMNLDYDILLKLINDSQFCMDCGIEDKSLEGYLFPDTYFFDAGSDEKTVLKKLVEEFHQNYTDALKARADSLNYTTHQVITLASIIEGEAVVSGERPIISALYQNRLKRRMYLQADPTIQYIISDGPRRLLNKDLDIDSPYNTYKYFGLPPGPVNNPGKASIEAALYPADVKYLYMVAKGDGSHTFSYRLQDHLKAKAQFDKIRRRHNGRRN